jgi:hypothetical protein
MSELVELIQVYELDLELKGSARRPPGERHQQTSVQTRGPGVLQLASDELHRLVSVDWKEVVGKASDVTRLFFMYHRVWAGSGGNVRRVVLHTSKHLVFGPAVTHRKEFVHAHARDVPA